MTLVAPKVEMLPTMRKAARMTKKQARAQMREAFAPPPNGSPGPALLEAMLNEPFERHRKRKAKKLGAPGLDDEIGL